VASSPRVSVGLPVYNGERFLAQALDSILAQTLEDYELLISDNGSTDGTEAICRTYASRDRRLRYVRNETNVGASINFNRVFELSSGEYFKWLAADDVCAPEFLERCVEMLDAEPAAVLAYPRAIWIDEHGKSIFDSDKIIGRMDLRGPVTARFRELVDELTYDEAWAGPMCIFGVIRSRALRQSRLLGNYIAADCNLLAELILIGEFLEVPERLSFIRLHPGSSTWLPSRSTRRAQQFFDPKIRSSARLMFYRWKHYLELSAAVAGAPLALRHKLALVTYSCRLPLRRLRKKLTGLRSPEERAHPRAAGLPISTPGSDASWQAVSESERGVRGEI
jgi:glycosyltransferase involved in cell wall biosynthesis